MRYGEKRGSPNKEARVVVISTKARYFAGLLGFLTLMLAAVVLARPAEAQQMEADLSVQKFDFPPTQVAVGEPLFYELAIANLGPDTAEGAVVVDDLPSNTEFLFTISGNCTNAGGTVTCDLGDLASFEQVFVEFAVCPTAPGTATNTATASSDTSDPDSSNNTATETTEVTTPAVGACPSQESPSPPEEPPPPPEDPQPDQPRPDPDPPEEPQPDEPAANAGFFCAPGALAVDAEDFSLACAGGQAIAAQGDVPDGLLAGDGFADEDPGDGQAVARNENSLAVSGGS